MRLIDADELLKKEKLIQVKEIGYTHRSIDPLDVIEAPTIEAIPVEWVQKQMSECVSYSIVWMVLRDLLREWERREDEADRR